MRGYVDSITFSSISGWAAGPNGTSVQVEIFADGIQIGCAECSSFREGLRKNGISNGYSGFSFAFSPPLDFSTDHTVTVRPAGSIEDLPGKKWLNRIDLQNFTQRGFKVDYPVGKLWIYQHEFSEKHCRISGAVLTNRDLPGQLRILKGGVLRSFEFEISPVEPALKAFNFQRWKFWASIEDNEGTTIEGELAIHDDRFCSPRAIFALPGRSYDSSYIPPPDSIKRVVGPMSNEQFSIRGLTDAKRFIEIVREHLDVTKSGRWLDWGCGPGRIAVPLKRQYLPKWQIHGADVDDYNIQIGKELAPDVCYDAIAFDPPLPFPDQYFDVIHGLSVFTHLTRRDQNIWLSELRRVLKQGGLLILTTHGETTILLKPELFLTNVVDKFVDVGFSDDLPDRNLGLLLSRKEYYRATIQSAVYTRKLFSRFFKIIEHIGSAQDIWVLGARS